MRQFMDYVQGAFYDATGWSRDSSYSSLNATADALFAFPTPCGLRLTVSSLATPHLATSYQLGGVGIVDGSISYLFSSVPLGAHITPASDNLPLRSLLRAYRTLSPALGPASQLRPGARPVMLYGQIHLPLSMLEALVVTRVSNAVQLQLRWVSSRSLRNGGTALGIAQYDVGRYAFEGLASSDGGLLGIRGVYHFVGDAERAERLSRDREAADAGPHTGSSVQHHPGPGGERERIHGRFTVGGEVYYGTLNKSGGVSVGARFATLPAHRGTPLTATLTLNPLMGNMSATYAVMAGRRCSLAGRFDFNVFSYESNWSVGMELWRSRPSSRPVEPPLSAVARGAELRVGSPQANDLACRLPEVRERPVDVATAVFWPKQRSLQARLEWRPDSPAEMATPAVACLLTPTAHATTTTPDASACATGRLHDGRRHGNVPEPGDEFGGVLKVRLDQHLKIGLLWEGRIKSLLFSVGSGVDLRKLDRLFQTIGVEIQYSS